MRTLTALKTISLSFKIVIRFIRVQIATFLNFFRLPHDWRKWPFGWNRLDIRDIYFKLKYPKAFKYVNLWETNKKKNNNIVNLWGIEAPAGWSKLLHRYLAILEANDCAVLQIKEKFGRLTIYYQVKNNSEYDRLHEFTAPIVQESMRTCTMCGKPGTLKKHGWVVPLCVEHMPSEVEEIDD